MMRPSRWPSMSRLSGRSRDGRPQGVEYGRSLVRPYNFNQVLFLFDTFLITGRLYVHRTCFSADFKNKCSERNSVTKST
jgi:hypothetical protein